jgi:FkbM family methyltransferase
MGLVSSRATAMKITRLAGKVILDRHPSFGARLLWRLEGERRKLEIAIMDLLVKSGAVVVDVGANWGFYSWRFSRLVGSRGQVHAFEPGPLALERLRKIQNSCSNVRTYPVALSNRAGQATLHVPYFEGRRQTALSSLSPGWLARGVGHESILVATECLDSILASREEVSFIKCDAEGHEQQVLLGAEKTLRRCTPSILIEIEQRHLAAGSVTDMFDYLLSLGYQGFCLAGAALKPIASFELQRDQLAFLTTEFFHDEMPAGYVRDFVFVTRASELGALLPRKTA